MDDWSNDEDLKDVDLQDLDHGEDSDDRKANKDYMTVGAHVDQTINTLNQALNGNRTVSQLAEHLTNTFGELFSPLQSLTEMEHNEREQAIHETINQVAQDLDSGDWLSNLLDVFTEGEKNDGLVRKGGRNN